MSGQVGRQAGRQADMYRWTDQYPHQVTKRGELSYVLLDQPEEGGRSAHQHLHTIEQLLGGLGKEEGGREREGGRGREGGREREGREGEWEGKRGREEEKE